MMAWLWELAALGYTSLTLVNAMEGIMRIKRTIIAPVALTLGSLGILAGSVAPVVASSASSVAVASSSSSSPNIMYGA